jgi:hypothetical protein
LLLAIFLPNMILEWHGTNNLFFTKNYEYFKRNTKKCAIQIFRNNFFLRKKNLG